MSTARNIGAMVGIIRVYSSKCLHMKLFQEYGDEVGQKLLQAITQQLVAFHTLNETLVHLSGSRFC